MPWVAIVSLFLPSIYRADIPAHFEPGSRSVIQPSANGDALTFIPFGDNDALTKSLKKLKLDQPPYNR